VIRAGGEAGCRHQKIQKLLSHIKRGWRRECYCKKFSTRSSKQFSVFARKAPQSDLHYPPNCPLFEGKADMLIAPRNVR
jgi:hypothetical protein